MRTVAPKTRQDHDISLRSSAALCTTLLLATLMLLPAPRAAAQGAVPCTAIDDDAQRLACYDRALRGTPAPATSPPPASTQSPNRNSPPAAVQAPTTPVAEAEPRRERRVRESAAPPAPVAPAAPAAGRDDDEQIVPIVVVGMRALPGRETTFTTQDGASWVQTDSQRIVGLPDTPFDAEIKRGAMGSYFLVAKDRPRAIRVRPVR
jgi:hypothetical protein